MIPGTAVAKGGLAAAVLPVSPAETSGMRALTFILSVVTATGIILAGGTTLIAADQ